MYHDKDFNNELVSLTDIQELEQFSTVSVVSIQVADAAECVASNSQVVAESSSSNMRQGMGWPDEFVLPKFDHDIELLLTKGNEEYSMNGKLLNLSKANKGAVVKKLVNSMYDIKAYPQVSEFRSVAQTLVAKYPCLQEPGSRSGFDGWTNSLVFKMGNYRTEIRKAGAEEVKVNGGRRSRYNRDLPCTAAAIKKPKRGEANYLPNIPVGHDAASLEDMRKLLEEENQKVTKDMNYVHSAMASTFAVRRQEIVTQMPRVASVVSRWPMLFDPSEVISVLLRNAR